jgi:protein-tyrosine phosphatase
MYDLHCHLLPAVDDGPATWADTFALARRLVEEGVTTVAATPHSYSHRADRAYYAARVKHLVEETQLKFIEQDIPLTVVGGAEILWAENTLARLMSGQLTGYNESRTLLLETSAFIQPEMLIRAVDGLIEAGYRVVLAHPEKLETVHTDPNVLIPLVERSVAMQITAANLAGLHGDRKQQLCEVLLRHGLAHLIASDAHAATGPRAPAMQAGYRAAKRLVGSRAYHLFVTIPKLILEGGALPPFRPSRVPSNRG